MDVLCFLTTVKVNNHNEVVMQAVTGVLAELSQSKAEGKGKRGGKQNSAVKLPFVALLLSYSNENETC